MIEKVIFLSDEFSYLKTQDVILKLKEYNINISDVKIISTCNVASDEEIINELAKISKCYDFIFAITSSGNGMAMFANKLERFVAAPIASLDDIDEAFTFSVNAFDVCCENPLSTEIFVEIAKRMGMIK